MKLIIKLVIKLVTLFKKYEHKRKWIKSNKQNQTIPINVFEPDIVKVGKMSYGPLEVYGWGAKNEKLIIGDYVSISNGVKFLLGGNHNYNTISTYPFKVTMCGEKQEAYSKGAIVVDDDAWIGTDTMILSGVKIGKGAVIAAGSVIVKDVPPYSIVGGNPAKIIKYRFENKIIDRLKDFDFNKITNDFILKNIDKLYKDLDEDILENLIEQLNNNGGNVK